MFTRLIAAFALAVSLIAGLPAMADQAAKPAITSTIQSQLDAFIRDDFEQAFTFASPNIKRIFRSPQNFGAMVQQGYPMVHRHSDVRFLDLQNAPNGPVQKVQVRDASGKVHLLEYKMIKTDAGWQINGVRLLKDVGFSA